MGAADHNRGGVETAWGCANCGCPEVVVAVVTACLDSLFSRWDGSAGGGGRRETLAFLREGRRHSVAGLGRPRASVIVEISKVMLAVAAYRLRAAGGSNRACYRFTLGMVALMGGVQP